MTNNYNTGDIEGSHDVGGICGYLIGYPVQVMGCYNVGKVTGNTEYGAIIGKDFQTTENTIEMCFYLKGTSDSGISNIADQDNVSEGMEEDKMKTKSFVDKLNSITINSGAWKGNDGEYPKLKWE